VADIVRKFIDTKTLFNPNFWFSYLVSSFGQIGEPFETEFVGKVFDVSGENTINWWNSFTGYYEGIFDETDGEVENPSSISIDLQNEIHLVIEFHAGDTYYFLENRSSVESATLGDIGPHWILPMLRWTEVVNLSKAINLDQRLENGDNLLILLLLPCVWITKNDDVSEIHKIVSDSWSKTGLVDFESAEMLASQFCKSTDGREKDYHWFLNDYNVWVTNATWSSRCSLKPYEEINQITNLLKLAIGK
jgi:Immunity protein 19